MNHRSERAAEPPPHVLAPDEVPSAFGTDIAAGLSVAEVSRRRRVHGPNIIRHRAPTSALRILTNQFESAVVGLLAIAAVVALASGHWNEGAAIVLVLVLNTLIGFITEIRATRSMEALRSLGTPVTRVRRGGHAEMVASKDLVPGDIVLLEGGDVITADLRVVQASAVAMDESALTGESVAVEKSTDPVAALTQVPDRICMMFKGTSVTRGSAVGVVTATGMSTELGKISRLVEEAQPEKSPLEHQLARLSGQLVRLTLVVVTVLGAVGIAGGGDPFLMIEASIALAVAAIPEGLPVVATMALARGMWRMARANAVIEQLSAVETLGATTVILTDKTGTLTENRMVVREVLTAAGAVRFEDGPPPDTSTRPARQTLRAMAICNNAEIGDGDRADSGDPLELALLRAAALAGFEQKALALQCPRVREDAFSSETKLMATVHAAGAGCVAYLKGAPEEILAGAASIATEDGDRPIEAADVSRWSAETENLAASGLRVLGIAMKRLKTAAEPATANVTFLGLVAMYDPPRPEIPDAIRRCREARIRVIMMTGDHVLTARNIASAIGLVEGEPQVIEGRDLKGLTELTPEETVAIREIDVFARVSPKQKLDLVTIHQHAGDVVAMTGDGVNDAPALKKADIGVAMGLRGTDVARQAAAMVLLDDAFGTIVRAVREGRVIFRNIQTFVTYLLSCNLSEILIVGLAMLSGLPLPLLPLQILFLNLVTDVFPAFALGVGEGEREVLRHMPRDPSKPILTRPIWFEISGHAGAITLATLAALLLGRGVLGLDGDALVTVSFLTLALAQLWHVFNMRDPRSGLVVNAVTRNRYVWLAVAFCVSLVLLVTYVPALSSVLKLVPPDQSTWLLIIVMSLLPLLLGQIGIAIAGSWRRRSRDR